MARNNSFRLFTHLNDNVKSVISSFISEQDMSMLLAFDPILVSEIACKDRLIMNSKNKVGQPPLIYLLYAIHTGLDTVNLNTKRAYGENKKKYYQFIRKSKKKRTNIEQFSDIYEKNILPPHRRCKKIITWLLENGADPNYTGYRIYTPLNLAISENRMDLVKLLLKFGADPNKIGFDPNHKMMGTPSLPSLRNTPLSEAITWYKYTIGSEKGTFFGNKRRSRFKMIKTLLEAGADPNLTIHHDKVYRESQFEQLLEYPGKMSEVIDLFIKYGADMNTKLTFVRSELCDPSPFLYLAQCNHVKCIKVFIDNGFDVNKVCDKLKQNAITKVVNDRGGHNINQMIKMLCDAGCDINKKDINGRSPLHVAVKNDICGSEYVSRHNIKTLLKLGAKIDGYRDTSGQTIVIDTVCQGNGDILQLILENGGKEFIHDKELDTGKTCLILAIINQDSKCVEVLLENGADPNMLCNEKRSPLMYACQVESYDLISLILENGGDPSLVDIGGFTALDYARSSCCCDATLELIEDYSDVAKIGVTVIY